MALNLCIVLASFRDRLELLQPSNARLLRSLLEGVVQRRVFETSHSR